MAIHPVCSIAGCEKPARARGWCLPHYKKWRKYRDPLGSPPPRPAKCSAEGCERQPYGRGMCQMHWQRWRVHGDPMAGGVPKRAGIAFLIDAISQHTNECILWPFRLNAQGYGSIQIDGEQMGAHRAALILSGSEPPASTALALHEPLVCHNRACVNILHLRWGDYAENASDMVEDGTSTFGERNPAAKLTEEQVVFIRHADRSLGDLADLFSVTRSCIHSVRTRRTWKHLD